MNFRTTLTLLGLLIVVLLVVLLSGNSGGPKTETETTAAKLLDLKREDVSRIALVSDDGQKITLQKTDGKWRLTEPVNAPADPDATNALLESITGLESRGQIDAAGADTGLAQPRFKLELTGKDNQVTRIDVGAKSGAGNNLYVKLNGNSKADVVQAGLYDSLDKPTKQWRRAKLLDIAAPDIKQIHVATTQTSYDLEKPDLNWKVAKPTSMPADTTAASDIAYAVSNLRAEDFVTTATDQAKRYGLDEPVMTISFSTAAPATQPSTSQPAFTTIQFGRFDDVLKKNVYASISTEPGVVKVQATSLDAFRKKPLELRDKAILSVEADKVTKVTIQSDKPATTQPTTREASSETTVLARAKIVTPATTGPATTQASTQPSEPPSKWQIASKNDIPADDSKVDRILTGLHPLRVDRFEETSTPTTSPAQTVVLTIETTDASHEVRLTDPGDGKPLIGMYNGLTFELGRFILDDLTADFEKKPTTPTTPIPFMAPGSPMPGSPMPGGANP